MKAKELRIGNLIYSDTKQVTVIDGFMNNSVYKNVDDERVRFILSNITYCNGILLTEEWLLKFGFGRIKQQNPNLSDTDYPYYFRINEGFTNEMTIEDLNSSVCFVFSYGRCSIIKIEYIHQLQNLYFALTGEELTLKP